MLDFLLTWFVPIFFQLSLASLLLLIGVLLSRSVRSITSSVVSLLMLSRESTIFKAFLVVYGLLIPITIPIRTSARLRYQKDCDCKEKQCHSSYGRVVYTRIADDPRIFTIPSRGSKHWKEEYNS